MYSKGMPTRDISSHLKSIYGIDVSHALVSKITNRVLPLAQEWQNRSLDTIYPIVFMYAIHYKVRSEGRIINKAAYIAIGINLEGVKDVLVFGSERMRALNTCLKFLQILKIEV